MTTITGYLYNAQGAAITTGTLSLTLQQDIVIGGQKVAPTTTVVDLSLMAPAGNISVALFPTVGASPAGVSYFVAFDPDPSDTTRPASSKPGYWSNYWSVPDTPSVALSWFASSLRGASTSNYLLLTSPSVAWTPVVQVVTSNKTLSALENGKTIVINTTTGTTVTLPSPSASLYFSVHINALAASGTHSIAPGTGVTIRGNGLSKAAAAALTHPTATDALGDWVELVALDTTTWWIVRSRGTWA